jgi:hypothetical protein
MDFVRVERSRTPDPTHVVVVVVCGPLGTPWGVVVVVAHVCPSTMLSDITSHSKTTHPKHTLQATASGE